MSGGRWVLLFILANLLFWQRGNPNPGSRLATLASMSQRMTFQIDPYVQGPLGWTNDWARGPDGHFYSNKAPGPMFIGYPLFWMVDHFLLRGLTDPYDRQKRERESLPIYNFVQSSVFQVLPFAFLTLLALMRLRSNGVSAGGLQVAAATVLFGNTAALLMNTYFGHGMAAMFLLAMALAWTQDDVAWSSFFFGWAVLCDYSLLVATPVYLMAVSASSTARFSRLKTMLIGLLVPITLWAFYHTCCFGRPWRMPMAFQSPEFVDLGSEPHTLWGIAHWVPQVFVGWQLLFGPSRGLLFTQPWILVLLPMAVGWLIAHEKTPQKRVLLGAVLGGFFSLFLMNMTFGEWHGGSTIGPRYLSSIFPLLGLALGMMWDQEAVWTRRVVGFTIGLSLLFAALVFSTTLFIPPGYPLWSALVHRLWSDPWNAHALRFELLLVGFAWASMGKPFDTGSPSPTPENKRSPQTLFTLLIPTYNETENIIGAVEAAHQALKEQPHEILVIDDDSPDGTSSVVERYAADHPWLKLSTRHHARGLSGAVLEGIRQSKGDWIGVMDADRSHDETLLPMLVQALQDGNELAVGSRRVPGGGADHWPWYRRLTSDMATALSLLWLNVPLSDPMSGYFVFDRRVYDRCQNRLEEKGYKILLELYCLGKPAQIRELPFIFKDRKQGYSKLNANVMGHYMKSLWRLRQYM